MRLLMIVSFKITMNIMQRLWVILLFVGERKVHSDNSGNFTASLNIVQKSETVHEYAFQDVKPRHLLLFKSISIEVKLSFLLLFVSEIEHLINAEEYGAHLVILIFEFEIRFLESQDTLLPIIRLLVLIFPLILFFPVLIVFIVVVLLAIRLLLVFLIFQLL
jgi:hypothetical protein